MGEIANLCLIVGFILMVVGSILWGIGMNGNDKKADNMRFAGKLFLFLSPIIIFSGFIFGR